MQDSIQEKVENKIIDYIIEECGSRVVIVEPENSNRDLVIEKRGEYKKEGIVLRIFAGDALRKDEIFDVDFSESKKEIHLFFAYFDTVKQDIEDSLWIMLPKELGQKTKVSFADLQKEYKSFMTSKKDIGKFVIKKLYKN